MLRHFRQRASNEGNAQSYVACILASSPSSLFARRLPAVAGSEFRCASELQVRLMGPKGIERCRLVVCVFGYHLQRIPGIMWTQGVFGNVKVTAWESFWLAGNF
jgi:hypothetical protein